LVSRLAEKRGGIKLRNLYPIISKKTLAEGIHRLDILSPLVARHARPGQFVIVRVDENGERIPLTIFDYDPQKGTVSIIFQEVGETTKKLALLKEGDSLTDFLGPLGVAIKEEFVGTVVSVGGGVGTASLFPKTRAFKELGNKMLSIIGARNKELLILEEEMRKFSDKLYITTDDGSYGRQGLVTDVLKEILSSGEKVNLVVAVGPVIMMKYVCLATRPFKIKTLVSLNPVMVDGTGMCGSCRVSVGGETKFTCVHGPIFDGHKVDFEELMRRNRRFLKEEKLAIKHFEKKKR